MSLELDRSGRRPTSDRRRQSSARYAGAAPTSDWCTSPRSWTQRADGLAASAAAVTLVWCGHTDWRLWPGGRQRRVALPFSVNTGIWCHRSHSDTYRVHCPVEIALPSRRRIKLILPWNELNRHRQILVASSFSLARKITLAVEQLPYFTIQTYVAHKPHSVEKNITRDLYF